MSLTEEAYYFYSLLESNNQESGGLFDGQPASVTGNITCITDPDEKVLGYFGVSQITTKRIFVKNVPGLSIAPQNFACTPQYLERIDWIVNTTENLWPIYMARRPLGSPEGFYHAQPYCFDCTLSGGSLEEPDFWYDDL